jgi:hypothetical protein
MEVIMKKIAFIVIMSFVLLAVSDTILAKTDTAKTDSDYDNALKYYNSKKYKEAVRIFKEYIKKKPDPSAYYRIGYALYELRKYDEATEYFKAAYLIDPTFSPELIGYTQKYTEGKIKEAAKPSGEEVTPGKKPHVPAVTEKQSEIKPEHIPEKQSSAKIQSQKAPEPVITPEKKALPPEASKLEPREKIKPPAGLPSFPPSKNFMPGPAPGILTGLMAGLGMIFLVLGVAVYLYACLCIFLIAKKLQVSAPWTAWIPIVQLWTIVSSAGKPGWWVILFIIPILGAIVYFYLWICITENLGKNKWLGLLMLLPVINLIFMGMLAFSKTEKLSSTMESVTPA